MQNQKENKMENDMEARYHLGAYMFGWLEHLFGCSNRALLVIVGANAFHSPEVQQRVPEVDASGFSRGSRRPSVPYRAPRSLIVFLASPRSVCVASTRL